MVDVTSMEGLKQTVVHVKENLIHSWQELAEDFHNNNDDGDHDQ